MDCARRHGNVGHGQELRFALQHLSHYHVELVSATQISGEPAPDPPELHIIQHQRTIFRQHYYFALKTPMTNNISPLSNVVSAGTTSTNDIHRGSVRI